MGSKTTFSLLLHLIILSITLTDAQECYTTGNFTANSTYAKNRDLVLRSLASNVTANGGFYNTTIGSGIDTVYGLAHCMASSSAENCSSCVNYAIQGLMTGCPYEKEALSWERNPLPCIVRYANRYFFGSLELSPTSILYNTGTIDATQFDQAWSAVRDIATRANSTNSSRNMLVTETADLSSTQTIYVYMQCTPDVSQSNCGECLQQSVDDYKSCCYSNQGGVVQKPNCFFRWDLYPYYSLFPQITSPSPPASPSPPPPPPASPSPPPPPPASPSPPPPPPASPSPPFIDSSPPPTSITITKGKENTTSRTVIVTTVPTAILLALVILILAIFRFRKRKQEVQNFDENDMLMYHYRGYIAPEYAKHGQFSVKSDVFSFGVLVLEIVSGRKQSSRNGEDIEHLLSHAWKSWRKGTASDLIDPILRGDSTAQMMRCIHIGLLCVQENVADRPTMASVNLMLSTSSCTLHRPSQPAYFFGSRTSQPASSLTMSYKSRTAVPSPSQLKTKPLSRNDISITEVHPR
ncbi:hypothetical protein OIU78_024424 [Salix suchowensis]|nr:hypothetical protein OIU78_024424 [Salix suchowensis]